MEATLLEYYSQLIDIVMMASSVVLFEGFLCVVMFMPIYFGIILLIFATQYLLETFKSTRNKLHLHLLPVIVIATTALEGVHPNLSVNRYNEVASTQIVNASINQIKRRLIQPVSLNDARNGLLALFPMPYRLDANSLQTGEIHKINYRYHRWFTTNTHEGYTLLKMAEVKDNYIRTEALKDSSYLSHYIKFHRTDIQLTAIDANHTRVTLTVKYDRLLDPAWYFSPLQKYTIKQTAKHLIAKMMASH